MSIIILPMSLWLLIRDIPLRNEKRKTMKKRMSIFSPCYESLTLPALQISASANAQGFSRFTAWPSLPRSRVAHQKDRTLSLLVLDGNVVVAEFSHTARNFDPFGVRNNIEASEFESIVL